LFLKERTDGHLSNFGENSAKGTIYSKQNRCSENAKASRKVHNHSYQNYRLLKHTTVYFLLPFNRNFCGWHHSHSRYQCHALLQFLKCLILRIRTQFCSATNLQLISFPFTLAKLVKYGFVLAILLRKRYTFVL